MIRRFTTLVLSAAVALLFVLPAACTRSESTETDTGVLQPDSNEGDSDLVAQDDNVTGQDSVVDPDTTVDPTDNQTDPDQTANTDGVKALQQTQEGLNCVDEPFINISNGISLTGVVVTTPVFGASAQFDGLFVQDADGGQYSGVKVVFEKGAVDLNIGDVVDITGDLKEYYCVTEIEATAITKTSSGATPVVSTVAGTDIATDNADSEPWEGVLVRLENVDVESVDNYGGLILAGNAYVDDLIFNFDKPQAGCRLASITGVLDYSYNQYRLLPRQASDVVLDETVECNGGQTGTTVKDIQSSETSLTCTGDAFVNAGSVSVSGLIVTSPRFVASANQYHAFFAADGEGGPYSGVMVLTNFDDDIDLSIGDIIDVSGEWTEYYCLTEIKADAGLDVVGHAEALVEPTAATQAELTGTNAEQYEGMLVTVSDATVAEVNSYGEAVLDGGLVIDDKFDITVPAAADSISSITGLIYYSYSKWYILPRTSADMVE